MHENSNSLHIGEVVASQNGYDAIECSHCGFIHIIPLPSDNDLAEYYKKVFYSEYKPDYIKNHRKDILWLNQIFEDRLDLFNQHLKQTHGRRILDIGSGPGYFLKYFKDNGWDTVGVEPSQTAAEYSKSMDIKIYQSSIYELSEEEIGKFDVIHSNQTFEHIVDPNNAIKIIKQLLKSDGLLFLNVANDFNPIQKILASKMGYNDWWFTPPEHINYFSLQSMQALLTKYDFETIHKTTTFPIDLFLLMGENYISDPIIGKECHERRKAFELNLKEANENEFKNRLYKPFSEINIGREIEILAKNII